MQFGISRCWRLNVTSRDLWQDSISHLQYTQYKSHITKKKV